MTNSSLALPRQLATTDVEAWLRAHPEFFIDRADVLTEPGLNDNDSAVISFAVGKAFMLKSQEEEKDLQKIFSQAHKNDRLFATAGALIAHMLEAEDVHHLLKALEARAIEDFDADATALHLFATSATVTLAEVAYLSPAAQTSIAALANSDGAVCGALRAVESEVIFGVNTSIQSAVVLPLEYKKIKGLLAFGSNSAHFFTTDMDTLFVDLIARVLERVLMIFVEGRQSNLIDARLG